MTIDFKYEINEIIPGLNIAEGYLACEQVIIHNIRKHLKKGYDDKIISIFLQKLAGYFKEIINERQSTGNTTNYRYAEGFVNTLIKMPYWKSWIHDI